MDYLSGKVYAYLKKKGIGKEDFVAICLPRGAQPVIAMLGVIKAGAAFVILESQYPPERIAFIRQDCGCRLFLDGAAWDEIQYCQSLEGHVEADLHDVAFAVYTSGTTGNPKGAVHEYGTFDRIVESHYLNDREFLNPDMRGALIAPLAFTASVIILSLLIYHGNTIHILPYGIAKNPKALVEYFTEKKIDFTFVSPSYLKAISSFGPYMKTVIVGSEPVSNVYSEKVQFYNLYSMSESPVLVAGFKIDRPYDVTPVGTPKFDLPFYICNEEGKRAEAGESGELCVYDPYFRGYNHMPEETARVLDKEHFYHTGDIVKQLPDGNLVIVGRNNDMIKINGNRVELGEIEAAAKKVLNLQWAVAKGFADSRGAYICLYYMADQEIDSEKAKNALKELLPYYMIPSYFIKLDAVPVNANE